MDNVKRSRMSFSVHNGSHSTGVTASSDHAQVSSLKLDAVHDFVGAQVQPDGVVGLDDGVRIANGATVRSVQIGHIFGASSDLANAAQLILGLLVGDPEDLKKWLKFQGNWSKIRL